MESVNARSSDKILSISRIATLAGCVLVALGSGANYAYSGYAPQLGTRLRLSHTQLNIIGLAGIMGANLSGPIWGRIVDRTGPRIPLIGASICFTVGYLGIKQMYDNGVDDVATLSAFLFATLVGCSVVTGMGGSAGISAALGTIAKSSPLTTRATATGLVFSGYGLSAFWLTALADMLSPGNTSAFLLILALGTASPMIVGLLVVKPVPLLCDSRDIAANEGYEPIPSEDAVGGMVVASDLVVDHEAERDPTSVLSQEQGPKPDPPELDAMDIYGHRLWLTQDFYLVFLIMGIWCGTALMYINNVGFISQALYAKTHAVYDDVEATKWQAAQVSILSLGNFAGRILSGLVSDFTHTRFRFPRVYSLYLVSSLFVVSQATAVAVSSIETLWIATILLGLAYGSSYGSLPTIIIEWFGVAHFAENWGYLIFSCLIGSSLFSLLFGYNLDAHTPADNMDFSLTPRASSLATMGLHGQLSERRCLDGKACYLDSLLVTLVACIISLGLSWWAGMRDRQKTRDRNALARVRE